MGLFNFMKISVTNCYSVPSYCWRQL